ncbi:MAG: MinD/ParA family protein [Mycobacterium sp.]|nr:MinD/ParA family protein [Mycobacterium sp.]
MDRDLDECYLRDSSSSESEGPRDTDAQSRVEEPAAPRGPVIDERAQANRGAGPHSWETGVIPAGAVGLGFDPSERAAAMLGEVGRSDAAARMEPSGTYPEPGEPRRQDEQSGPGSPDVDRRTVPLLLRNLNGVYEDDAAQPRMRNHRGGPRPGATPMLGGDSALFGGDPALYRNSRASWGQTSAEGDAGFSGGTASSHLWRDQLVKTRKAPPEIGWRKAVYVATGRLLNLGAGPSECILRDNISKIGTNIPGNYQVAVLSIKGGVGKTRTCAGLGTVYGMYRTEPVIALDANPTYGNLGRLIDPDTRSSIREFIADTKVTSSYPKARCHTGKNKQGLEVLAGNQNLANPFALDADTFTDTLARTQRFYQLSLIDCGHEIEHPVMSAVLEAVDALVIVGSMNFDGIGAAEQTLDWLDARNKHDLLRRSVLVLNDVYRCRSTSFVAEVRNSLGTRVGDLKTIPWDRHLRDGAVLDFEALRRRTQLAYIEVAAWLAQGFASGGAGAR